MASYKANQNEENEHLVKYDLCDISGNVFTLNVPQREAELLDLDHHRRFRQLKLLKEANVVPSSRWGDISSIGAIDPSPPFVTSSPQPELPSEHPRDAVNGPSRASGKCGAKWPKDACHAMLQACRVLREDLRRRVVPIGIYQSISDTLWAKDPLTLNYSAEMLKEKLRNLKNSFREAKQKRHFDWEYFDEMKFLMDAPVVPDMSKDLPSNHINVPVHEVMSETFTVSANNCAGFTVDKNGTLIISNDQQDPQQNDHELGFDSFLMDDIDIDKNNNTAQESQVTTPSKSLQSPAKKRNKDDCVGKVVVRTPTKTPTPKRKIPGQCNAVWPEAVTEAFMKQCVLHKAHVQKENVPLDTWKDIANYLLKNGHGNVTWQQCRSRFMYMTLFFSGAMLPLNGVLGGHKWPHYDNMLEIHDFPKGYEIPVNTAPSTLSTGDGKLWDEAKVLLLINLYKDRYHIFKSKSMIRHSTLYSEISAILNMFEVPATADQCKNKIKELEMEFRKEYDCSRKTGASPSSWVFFKPMQEIYGDNASLEAVYAFSVGGKTLYTCKGTEVENVERSSRTRPQAASTASSKAAVKKEKKFVFKSNATELQERQVAAKEDLANEVRLLRTGMETSSRRRLDLMEALVASVSKLSQNEKK